MTTHVQTPNPKLPNRGPPFLNDPDADVIIRAGDVDFRVRKAVLSEASDFFKQMFTLPQGSAGVNDNGNGDGHSHRVGRSSEDGFVDGLAVIPVSEPEEVMSLFLRCVFSPLSTCMNCNEKLLSLQDCVTHAKTTRSPHSQKPRSP